MGERTHGAPARKMQSKSAGEREETATEDSHFAMSPLVSHRVSFSVLKPSPSEKASTGILPPLMLASVTSQPLPVKV